MRVWIEGRELSPSEFVIEGNALRILADPRKFERLRDMLERQEGSILHVEEKINILQSHLVEMKQCRDDIKATLNEKYDD